MKVYVITQGFYEDMEVITVLTSEKTAQSYSAKLFQGDYFECELDEIPGPLVTYDEE